MASFLLPETRPDCAADFSDPDSAGIWLSHQTQANAPAMVSTLATQLGLLNRYRMPARARFKTVEVLRKTAVTVSQASRARYENRPLPLLAAEQQIFETSCALWRAFAVAYLHCLHACLENDASIARHGALVAHRVLTCLRQEQRNCYAGGCEIDGTFWQTLHAVFSAAERLNVVNLSVTDRLLAETHESTVKGEYCLALLLHLAQPAALSRGQQAAAARWLARWRERADVGVEPQSGSCSLALTLDPAATCAFAAPAAAGAQQRRLFLSGVLHKIERRLKHLADGQSPESLHLGTGLSSTEATDLLNTLALRLRYPQADSPSRQGPHVGKYLAVLAGQECIFRHLGGRGLAAPPTRNTSFYSQLNQNQIAVFGHVVREEETAHAHEITSWQILEHSAEAWSLQGHGNDRMPRIAFGDLWAVRAAATDPWLLGSVRRLSWRTGGTILVLIHFLSDAPLPLVAEATDRARGKTSRHPAFRLPPDEAGNPASLILPAGLMVRSSSLRFFSGLDAQPLSLQFERCLERTGNYEQWLIVEEDPTIPHAPA